MKRPFPEVSSFASNFTLTSKLIKAALRGQDSHIKGRGNFFERSERGQKIRMISVLIKHDLDITHKSSCLRQLDVVDKNRARCKQRTLFYGLCD